MPAYSDRPQNSVRPSRPARHEAPSVNRSLAVRPSSGFYHRHAVHVRPLAPVVRVSDHGRDGRRPVLATLDAPMPLVHGLENVMLQSGEPRSRAVFEGACYVVPQLGLVLLDRHDLPFGGFPAPFCHSMNVSWNLRASTSEKTLPKASCESIPLESSRNVSTHSSLGVSEGFDIAPVVGDRDDGADGYGLRLSHAASPVTEFDAILTHIPHFI